MATNGKMNYFDTAEESWETYSERLEQYFSSKASKYFEVPSKLIWRQYLLFTHKFNSTRQTFNKDYNIKIFVDVYMH